MRAEDVLPDRQNEVRLGDVVARKGSVAAFLANARVLADPAADAEARAQAERDTRDLLPALRALGLFDVLDVRDAGVRDWLCAQLAALPPRVR
ncbi:hypothetical protein [Lysobacter enzymogenes]|uniref:Preprotein translocase subunit SecD n=1 Tax=Lysobacter enzymogenes TaxID=69 RepID=A0A3N2RAX9_LYSEN|nr:hypothetical protein [Lysobacter enzymogenes]ROU04568.1 hypothetical protein D9T17_23260 [Lysobacter enzymogenes]